MSVWTAKSVNNKKHKLQKLHSFAEMQEIMSDGMVSRIIQKVREINEKLRYLDCKGEEHKTLEGEKIRMKKQLPTFCFQGEFDGERTNGSARSNGLVMYDGDHLFEVIAGMVAEGELSEMPDFGKEMPFELLYRHRIKGRENELQIAFASGSCSVDGLRVVFVKPDGMDIPQAQEWFSHEIGLPGDGCVKDLARCSFVTLPEDVLYVNEDRLFGTPIPPEDDPANVTSRMSKRVLAKGAGKKMASASVATVSTIAADYNPNLKIDGVLISDLVPRYWQRLQGKGIIKGNAPVEGERHNSLMCLARDLAPFLDMNAGLVLSALPRLKDDEREMADIARDSVEYLVSNGITKRSKEVSELIKRVKGENILTQAYPTVDECIEFENGLPKTPKCMNMALKILAHGYRFPALLVLLALAMCLAEKVRVAKGLFDADRLRALLHIDAFSGVGKSLTYKPAQAVMRTFVELSAKAEEERRKWLKSSGASSGKKDKKGKAEAEEERLFPDLRLMPQATSDNAQLEISRHGHTLLTLETELDAMVRQFKKSSYDRSPRLIPAFDGTGHGNLTCVAGSVNGSSVTNWVVITSGTRSALHALVKWHGNENDGLPNRLAIGVLPREKGTLIAKYSESNLDDLRHLGEVLMMMKGHLYSPRLNKALDEWEKQFKGEASSMQESVRRSLAGRVAFIAFRFASAMQLYYIADKVMAQEKKGERNAEDSIDVSDFAEPKAIAEWGEIFADYFLDKQWSIFGTNMVKRIQESFSSVIVSAKRNDEWLDSLPDTFTYDDVRIAVGAASASSAIRMKVKRARERGLVEVVDDDPRKPVFKKL